MDFKELDFSNFDSVATSCVWIAVAVSGLAFLCCAFSKAQPSTLYIWGILLLIGAALCIYALWSLDFAAFASKKLSADELRFLGGRVQSAILIVSILFGAGGINLLTTGISRKEPLKPKS